MKHDEKGPHRAHLLPSDARQRLVRLEIERVVNARFEDAVPSREVLRRSRLETLVADVTLALAVHAEIRHKGGVHSAMPGIERFVQAHAAEIQRRSLLAEQLRAHAKAG